MFDLVYNNFDKKIISGKNIIALLLLATLALGGPLITNYEPTDAIYVCSAAGTINLQSNPTNYSPDQVSSYWDASMKESVFLLVKYCVDGTNTFKFISFNRTLQTTIYWTNKR